MMPKRTKCVCACTLLVTFVFCVQDNIEMEPSSNVSDNNVPKKKRQLPTGPPPLDKKKSTSKSKGADDSSEDDVSLLLSLNYFNTIDWNNKVMVLLLHRVGT
jgi:hypothetical protein